MIFYSEKEFERDIEILAQKIDCKKYTSIYPIPRGGVYIGIALSIRLKLPLTTKSHIHKSTLIIDDLVDSGATRKRYIDNDFACIHIKKQTPENLFPNYYAQVEDDWIEYFWEKYSDEQPAEDAVTRLIEMIGEDPTREGLIETPKRVVKSYAELFSGYQETPEDVFKTFNDEKEQFGGLVYLKDIEFYSMCEHHMLPFFGKALIAYIPSGPVIGASKMARLLDIFSKRLQMQERIGEQVTNALMKYLNPLGAACLIEAKHLCIACRGVRKQHSIMGYNSIKGVFLEDSNKGLAARNELMRLIR